MSDLSDDVNDLISYYKLISKQNLDGVFGSRFLKKSKIKNYPFIKLVLNRIFNKFVQILFFSNFNDFTNAFKVYKREKLEIPLKFFIKKNSFKVIPINWTGRKQGISKFVIKELSFNYFKTLLKCFLRIS